MKFSIASQREDLAHRLQVIQDMQLGASTKERAEATEAAVQATLAAFPQQRLDSSQAIIDSLPDKWPWDRTT
jgi:ABC-type branched-subunit amino acid transport system ATPase component